MDKEGRTVDFLLTTRRDKAAAKRFFDKAMQANDVPGKVTMDKTGANKAAIDEINASREIPLVVHQVKYLNNIVEQDQRAVKRVAVDILDKVYETGRKAAEHFKSTLNIIADTILPQ